MVFKIDLEQEAISQGKQLRKNIDDQLGITLKEITPNKLFIDRKAKGHFSPGTDTNPNNITLYREILSGVAREYELINPNLKIKAKLKRNGYRVNLTFRLV